MVCTPTSEGDYTESSANYDCPFGCQNGACLGQPNGEYQFTPVGQFDNAFLGDIASDGSKLYLGIYNDHETNQY